MALFEDLYQRGNTIILVTHERDIAGARAAHRAFYATVLIELTNAGFIPELDLVALDRPMINRDGILILESAGPSDCCGIGTQTFSLVRPAELHSAE